MIAAVPCSAGRTDLVQVETWKRPCARVAQALIVLTCCDDHPNKEVPLCVGHAIEFNALMGGPLLTDLVESAMRKRTARLNHQRNGDG